MSVRFTPPPPFVGVRAPPDRPNHPLLLPTPVAFFRLRNSKFLQQHFICKARISGATDEPGPSSARGFTTIPSSLLAAEREEAKAVLSLFLIKQGSSNAAAARTINKSDCFVDYLISILHTKHKSRYLVGSNSFEHTYAPFLLSSLEHARSSRSIISFRFSGRELTTLEIRSALVPHLEALLEEHGDMLMVDVVENYPNPPPSPSPSPSPAVVIASDPTSRKERAIARISRRNSQGLLSAQVLYLMGLGMELDQITSIARRFPAFAYYSPDRKIKPVVDLLLDLGVHRSDIPTILNKRPQLCGISFSQNLMPTMAYFESLGVDKRQWGKVICRFPALLTYSKQKVRATLDYFAELGVPEKKVGKILTRCPQIISYSVDDKLRPTAEYFRSLDVDAASLIHRCPQTFGLSIETSLKPTTEFLLGRGYSVEDVGTMVCRYGALYTFSLADNLKPKWEFFLTMEYPRSELVKFPHYFGYSLAGRIKPRYSRMTECGVRLVLNQVLSVSDSKFESVLEKRKKMDKLLLKKI